MIKTHVFQRKLLYSLIEFGLVFTAQASWSWELPVYFWKSGALVLGSTVPDFSPKEVKRKSLLVWSGLTRSWYQIFRKNMYTPSLEKYKSFEETKLNIELKKLFYEFKNSLSSKHPPMYRARNSLQLTLKNLDSSSWWLHSFLLGTVEKCSPYM